MIQRIADDEATPTGMPSSDRQVTETAVHQQTDGHQTEAAEQAVRQEVDKKTRPELDPR